MLISIRTDSSLKIGSGHVMRCLTLAEELRDSGATVEFIAKNHQENINEQIKSKGFKIHLLSDSTINKQQSLIGYEQWLGVKQDIDANETIQIVKDREVDWLIIDHYGIDNNWEEKLRPYTKNIMVIDDLANRKHDCDILLDQNYINDERRYDHIVSLGTIKLLGPKYTLLRKEFISNKNNRTQNNIIKRVFIYFGGSDLGDLTTLVVNALTQPKLKHLLADVVIGSANQFQSELNEKIEKHPNINLHIQVNNISKLMSKADLAIGAGGATTWERMAMGLPSIVVTVADNQVAFTKDLDRDDYIKWLGNADQVDNKIICNALLDAINNSDRLQNQSRKCQELINGKGLQVVSKLLTTAPDSETLSVRKAKLTDVSLYWQWENNLVVRKNTIKWQEYQEWFNGVLNHTDTVLLLMGSSFCPIGLVLFERSGSHYTISYSLVKYFSKFHLSKKMLSMAVEYLRNENAFTLIGEQKESVSRLKKPLKNFGFTLSFPLKKRGESFSITILSDSTAWMTPWIALLIAEWVELGHKISWVHKPSMVPKGDFCFILSCSKILKPNILSRNKHNLVIHASDLPKGKGMSPMSWQILEGKSEIQVTLFEAAKELDAGDIYIQECITFEGSELIDELRTILAGTIIKLSVLFVSSYPDVLSNASKQKGEEHFYAKRIEEDSKLDIDKTIRDQFQLLRIVDNEKYPAYFELNGCKYILRINKCKVD
jgi:UDP-2,4-diacetamido-2,4,6-trideoxy-beta-L-altropyranose hydrolase